MRTLDDILKNGFVLDDSSQYLTIEELIKKLEKRIEDEKKEYLKKSLERAKNGASFTIEPVIKYNFEPNLISIFFFFKDNMSENDFDTSSTMVAEIISDFSDDFDLVEDYTSDSNKFNDYKGFIL